MSDKALPDNMYEIISAIVKYIDRTDAKLSAGNNRASAKDFSGTERIPR